MRGILICTLLVLCGLSFSNAWVAHAVQHFRPGPFVRDPPAPVAPDAPLSEEIPRPHARPLHRYDVCKWVKCPPYSVVKKYEGFELREYNAYTLASITVKGGKKIATQQLRLMQNRLNKYFNGANEEEKAMDRTSPVVVSVVKTPKPEDPEKNFSYSMSFYVSDGLKAPKPTDKEIRVKGYPKHRNYVRGFENPKYFCLDDSMQELKQLEKNITEIKGKVYTNLLETATYETPISRSQLYHEVAFSEVNEKKMEEAEIYDLAAFFKRL